MALQATEAVLFSRLGFILPHKFFNAKYGAPVRQLIMKGKHLSEVIHFGDEQVFSGATTYTCLMFLDKAGTKECRFVKVDDLVEWRANGEADEGKVPIASVTSDEWNFVVGSGSGLFERMRQLPVKLEHVASRIFQGIKTSADKIYIVEEIGREDDRVKVFSRQKDAEYWLDAYLLHPLVKGGDSRRYHLSRTKRLILFPYATQGEGAAAIIPQAKIEEHYPLTWNYLLDNKPYLENREHGKMRGEKWYGYGRVQALDVMPLPKIFTPDIAARASFSLDRIGDIFFTGGVAGGYGILIKSEYSREYVLGLLSSKVLEWFIRQTATRMRGGYYSYESRFIRHLPIRTIDFSNPQDVTRHDRMVELVDRMLTLHEQLAAARIGQEKTIIQRQIDATDRQIDQRVYELYGLTEEEIRIVEESTP